MRPTTNQLNAQLDRLAGYEGTKTERHSMGAWSQDASLLEPVGGVGAFLRLKL